MRRYFWVLLVALVVVVAVGLLVLSLSGLLLPLSLAFVPIAVAGFGTGREQARVAEAPVTLAALGAMAVRLTLVTVALYGFVLGGAVLSQGASLTAMVEVAGRLALPIAIMIALAFSTLLTALWLGMRSRG